jgi:hypothetical protein
MPPYEVHPGSDIVQVANDLPADEPLRLTIRGPDFDNPDKISELAILVDPADSGDVMERLDKAGLLAMEDGDKLVLEEPMAGTAFFTKFQMFDFYGDEPVEVSEVLLPAHRPVKEIFYIPALALLALIVWLQRRRQALPVAMPAQAGGA